MGGRASLGGTRTCLGRVPRLGRLSFLFCNLSGSSESGEPPDVDTIFDLFMYCSLSGEVSKPFWLKVHFA